MAPSPFDRLAQPLAALRSRVVAASARIAASVPFQPGPQPPTNIPPPAWNSDQPPPAPARPDFRRGYHDATLRAYAAPVAFEGWTVDRMRAACALHRQGNFLESSLLAIACLAFGPVQAALAQAIAPALALPRQVRGGDKGLAKYLAGEIASQLAPNDGLRDSPYFPRTIVGSCAIDYRMHGFAVLQHAYGDEDPETGVRQVWTRRWPTWATRAYRYRRTFVAETDRGPVDIISGDGKFTLLMDTEEGYLDSAAILALGTETLDGAAARAARAHYIDLYGDPKRVAKMQEKVAVRSPEGEDFFEALQEVKNPDGMIVLPYGAELDFVQLKAETSKVFGDALDSVWRFVAAIMLGSDGTMSKGTGGVYTSPVFAGVRRDLVDRMLKTIVRGVNTGHSGPFLEFGYGAAIAAAKRAGTWRDPLLDIPLPDPDADARRKSLADRSMKVCEIIEAKGKAGIIVSQDDSDALHRELVPELVPPALANKRPRLDITPTDRAKCYTADEVREDDGREPMGDERGELLIVELDAVAKGKPPGDPEAKQGPAAVPKGNADGEPTGDAQDKTVAAPHDARTTALLTALDVALRAP